MSEEDFGFEEREMLMSQEALQVLTEDEQVWLFYFYSQQAWVKNTLLLLSGEEEANKESFVNEVLRAQLNSAIESGVQAYVEFRWEGRPEISHVMEKFSKTEEGYRLLSRAYQSRLLGEAEQFKEDEAEAMIGLYHFIALRNVAEEIMGRLGLELFLRTLPMDTTFRSPTEETLTLKRHAARLTRREIRAVLKNLLREHAGNQRYRNFIDRVKRAIGLP